MIILFVGDSVVRVKQLQNLQIFVQLTLLLKEVPLRTGDLQSIEMGKHLFYDQETGQFNLYVSNFKSINNEKFGPFSYLFTMETSKILFDFITL